MNALICSCEMPLGFNILEVLLHMFNLALLIIGIRFLVYKPVKKFMDKRKEMYKAQEDAANTAIAEAEDLKAKYEQALANAQSDAQAIGEQTIKEATEKAKSIVSSAESEAESIKAKADIEAAKSKTEAESKLAASVSNLAVNMASEILGREVKKEDNDAVIDSLINEWSKNENDNR